MNYYDEEQVVDLTSINHAVGDSSYSSSDSTTQMNVRKPLSKIDILMDSLEEERKRSAELLNELRVQSKATATLKKMVIGLCVFASLLAIANVGTSMATAMMIKDTRVNAQGDLTDVHTGARLGTTSKSVTISMSPITNSNRRRLDALVCGTTEGSNRICRVQGEMKLEEAQLLYKQFCPGWPNSNSCGNGVNQILLNCEGKISTLFGGNSLPSAGPVDNGDYVAFPTSSEGYYGEQLVMHRKSTTSIATPSDYCKQDFRAGMFCYKDDTACYVFAAWDPICSSGDVEVCPNNMY